MDFFKSAFTGLVPGAHEDVQRSNNQEQEDAAVPHTYDVEEYTRIITGKADTEKAAAAFSFIPITSPRVPSPPQTEHLNAFWKDEFDGSLHNPMLSASGTGQAAVSINNSRSNVSALMSGRNSRNNSVVGSNNEGGKPAGDRKASVDASKAPRTSRASNAVPVFQQPTALQPTIPEEPEQGQAASSGAAKPDSSPPATGTSPSAPRQLLGTRDGEMNLILALPIVYIAFRRCHRALIRRRKEEAARRGKLLDMAPSAEEKEAQERAHYKQFKRMLLSRQGIRVRLHDLAESKDVQLKVDSSRKSLLLVRGMTAQKVALGSLTEVKRGKATEVFKKKDKLKGLQASRCFSVISSDPKIGDLDFEVVDGQNSYKKGATAAADIAGKNQQEQQQPQDDGPASSPTPLSMDPLMGMGEAYLNDRKFYANGFERLISELNGPESFWWDPNGSLRKVSLSAFDERMLIQRKMGLLDLDESEAEKKKRREEEEREKARIKTMQDKALARKLKDDMVRAKAEAKKNAAQERVRLAREKKQEAKRSKRGGGGAGGKAGAGGGKDLAEAQKAAEAAAAKAKAELDALRAARREELERQKRLLLGQEDAVRTARREEARRKAELREAARQAKQKADEPPPSVLGFLGPSLKFLSGLLDEPEEEEDKRGYLEEIEEEEAEEEEEEDEEDEDEEDDGEEDEDSDDYDEDEEDEDEEEDDEDEGDDDDDEEDEEEDDEGDTEDGEETGDGDDDSEEEGDAGDEDDEDDDDEEEEEDVSRA